MIKYIKYINHNLIKTLIHFFMVKSELNTTKIQQKPSFFMVKIWVH